MSSVAIAPYPHVTWFGAWRAVGRTGEKIELQMRQTAHSFIYTDRTSASVRWIRRGREERFQVNAGAVRFCPADDDEHTLIGRCAPWHRFYALLIPRQQLCDIAEAEGILSVPYLRHSVSARDAVLTSCMRTLSRAQESRGQDGAEGQDVAGLTLILRLMAMNGCRAPDWNTDDSVFGRRVLQDIVDYVDEHLRPTPSLSHVAFLVGMSPGHFAKKFRQSTGLSFHRFVTHRRIRRALTMLQDASARIARIADDVGFASQSHFTRLFSNFTGMTPASYRKQFERVVG